MVEFDIVTGYRINIVQHPHRQHRVFRVVFTLESGKEKARDISADINGPIIPSPGAYIVNGVEIMGESSATVTRVNFQITVKSSEVTAGGSGMMFSYAMGQFLKEHKRTRDNIKIDSWAKESVSEFGPRDLQHITWKDVSAWVSRIAPKYADNTIKHKLTPARMMFDHMMKTGVITMGVNPFEGHTWRAGQGERDKLEYISIEDFLRLEQKITDPYLLQAVRLGFFTGVRPGCVVRCQRQDIDHEKRTMTVRESKTGKRLRLIRIPKALSVRVINTPEWFTLKESTLNTKLLRFKESHQEWAGLTMSTFRETFGTLMELHGISDNAIFAHQDHNQSDTARKYYRKYRNRVIELMDRDRAMDVFDKVVFG